MEKLIHQQQGKWWLKELQQAVATKEQSTKKLQTGQAFRQKSGNDPIFLAKTWERYNAWHAFCPQVDYRIESSQLAAA